jgi:predicted ATPase/class 3 adenylate cyclase
MLEIDGYSDLRALHRGARSLVLRGRRSRDGFPVVIKTPVADFPSSLDLRKLRREFELTQTDEFSPARTHVVQHLALTQVGSSLALILEDFGGESLAQSARASELGIPEFLDRALAITRAVQGLHEASIVHLDINPTNVLCNTDTGQVRLCDLSAAVRLGSRAAPVPGIGSPLYTSPEQAQRASVAVDLRSDLYSLGVTLFELLTGQLPFRGKDPLEAFHRHLAAAPPSPSEFRGDVPAALANVLLKLLEKGVEERYRSARGLGADLQRCRQQLSTRTSTRFALGSDDPSPQLALPQRLYGRERELADLDAALDRAGQGAKVVVLVSGDPGVGKSTLVERLRERVLARGGHFCAGKFEPLRANVPYNAFSEALHAFVRTVLLRPEAELLRWRERLTAALGTNAQLLARLVPGLERLLGTRSDVRPLGPEQTQARFNQLVQSFIEAIATFGAPLVLFVDDLQWADPASAALIDQLVTSDRFGHLMLVLAHRSNELQAGRVAALLRRLDTDDSALRITLAPLQLAHVAQFVSECLGQTSDVSQPLAELVWRKTAGNPFFMRQFLKLLDNERLLWFEPSTRGWCWDLDGAETQSMTDNVVVLMARRIHRLRPGAQRVLRHASCIGSEFGTDTLALVLPEERAAGLQAALAEALNEELIAPVGADVAAAAPTRFRFLHDHVQQAAYTLIPDAERPALHLAIGRLLLAAYSPDEREGRIFRILDHLIRGVHLVDQSAERLRIVEVCLAAGKRAKAANAYGAAMRYLRSGLELLGPGAWRDGYELVLELHREHAESCYLNGDLADMATSCSAIIDHARTLLDKVAAYQLEMTAHVARHQMPEAIATAREVLGMLGVTLPTNPSRASAAMGVARAAWRMRGETEESLLGRAPMTDPHMLAATQLLSLAAAPAYLTSPNLFPVVVGETLALALEHGTSEWAADALLSWSAIQVALGRTKQGHRVGLVALHLVDRLGADRMRGRITTNYNLLIRHWVEPLRSTLEPLHGAIHDALEHGDLANASVAAVTHGFYTLASGQPLAEVEETAIAHQKLLSRLGQARFRQDALRLLQLVHCLQGRVEEPWNLRGEFFDDREAMQQNHQARDRAAIASLSYEQALLSYLYGNPAVALDCCETSARHIDSLLATVYPPALDLLSALVRARLLTVDARRLSRRSELGKVRASLRRLQKWARAARENHQHRVHLVRAELERVSGRAELAIAEYELAIELAGRHGYLHEQAMALECAGRFYLRLGQRRMASATLAAARSAFASWGATAKATALDSEFSLLMSAPPKLLRHPSADPVTSAAGVALRSLDVASIMKASQTIISEMRLPHLVRRLLALAMENTGAQRGFLLLNDAGQLRIEAASDVDNSEAFVGVCSLPLARGSDLLAVSIVEYVARVVELRVHADVGADPLFSHDPYVAEQRPVSVLCVPLVSQGVLGGIVYLENNRMRGAFNAERVEVLNVLSSVAAIALENARLYADVAKAHALQTRVSEAQARFVPEEFLRSLQRQSIVDVALGDNIRKEMSILFSDVRGFTRLVESMPAPEHIGFINEYLGRMEPAIVENGGFVDSYLGDGIMALFEGDVENAVRAGIKMSVELGRFNAERRLAGLDPIEMGVGISTGPLTLGTIGGAMRIKCGVIGDPVNLASRIESLTKHLGCALLISHHTRELLGDPPPFDLRLVDRVRVKGKLLPITLFEVLDAEPPARAEAKRRTLPHFDAAMAEYVQGHFELAERLFCECSRQCPGDGAAATLAARSRRYRTEPPLEWTGIDTLTEK